MNLDAQTLPVPQETVAFRRLSNGAVVHDLATELYYGLDDVGARVWELLPACDTAEELLARIAAEYPNAEPERLRADVLALLDSLGRCGLLRPSA